MKISKKRKFLFTGGGTGGHVTPNIAISEALRELYDVPNYRYVGKKGKAEASVVPKEWKGYSQNEKSVLYVATTSGSVTNPKVLFQLVKGFFKACGILLRFKPDAIIATGGYVSAPIIVAGGILRKCRLIKSKLFIHEANAELGRMNALGVKFADAVGTSFPGAKVSKDKKIFVGYPIRKRLLINQQTDREARKKEARERLEIPEDAKVIFAFGGSQGARTINRGVVDALPRLLSDPKVYVLHGTGKNMGGAYVGQDDVQSRLATVQDELPTDYAIRYFYTDYIDNMDDYYAAADLVVCRGGAGSLVEICGNGLASICIPKANIAGDHQAVNAMVLQNLGATRVVFERVDITSGETIETVEPTEFASIAMELLNDPATRAKMGAIARQQYDATSPMLCARVIANLLGDITEKPEPLVEPTLEDSRVLDKSADALCALLRKAQKGQVKPLSEVERQLILYKADSLSAQSNLVGPARACRVLGTGKFTERLDLLLMYAVDQSKSGFTRRDACKGLGWMGVLNQGVVDTLLEVTKDDYFEAVTEALVAIYTLLNQRWDERDKDRKKTAKDIFSDLDVSKIKSAVKPLSESRLFDVRLNALGVLSVLATSFDEIKEEFEVNYFHPNWQVRKRLVACFADLNKRGLLSSDDLKDILENRFLQTSHGFDTQFQLKKELIGVYQREKIEKIEQDVSHSFTDNSSPEDKIESLKEIVHAVQKDDLQVDLVEMLTEVKEDLEDSITTCFSIEELRVQARNAREVNEYEEVKEQIEKTLQQKDLSTEDRKALEDLSHSVITLGGL